MNKKCLFVAALLIVCCFAQLLIAQNAIPAGKRGLKIDYQALLPNAEYGKLPIRFRITRVPPVPATNDLHFNVMASNAWDVESRHSPSSSAELILPGGKTSAEVELLVDLADGNDYCTLLVEQGKRHTNSIGNDLLHEQFNNHQNLGTLDPSWLLISSNAPKNQLVSSKTYYPGQNVNGYGYGNSVASGQLTFAGCFGDGGGKPIPGLKKIFSQPLLSVLNLPNWHALHPAELPETWMGLSSISYILISNDEFKSLTQTPGDRKIIEQWVASGGCLIIFNSDDSLSHAASVFPSLLGSERTKPARLWSPISSGNRNSNFKNQWTRYAQKQKLKPANELVAKDRLAFASYLNGAVAVMVSPEKIPNGFSKTHFSNSISGTKRSLRVDNFGRQSAIPGVGKPPIALFGIFTGLFLFLIGPVILMIVTLNNDRRFLFFLVPVFSFLTCTGILGYAIVADFNKQWARTDTLTVLDSHAGFAYSQTSSAYYCGNQPSYYAYDTDTFVQTTLDDDSGFRIRQLAKENQLSSPRIQPRKNHEVFTAKPYRTQQRLLVAESAEQPGVPEVTNLLGSRIERVSFQYDGKQYMIRDLEPKQTALGIEMRLVDCRKELLEAVSNRQIRGGSSFFGTNTSQIKNAINNQKAGTFVAIIDSNPAIEPLIEPFEYKLQLHVVHGKYN